MFAPIYLYICTLSSLHKAASIYEILNEIGGVFFVTRYIKRYTVYFRLVIRLIQMGVKFF